MKTPSRVALLSMAHKLMSQRLDIPEGVSGDLAIQHENKKPGDKLTVVGMRESCFTGLPQTSLELHEPTIIRSLKSKEDGVWMTDQPCELVQMWRELALHASGRVLIGGLGLGIAARMAALKKSVKSVTVIEKNTDVINLVGSYINHSTSILTADLFEYIRQIVPRQYDCALLDIWQGTGEWVWQTQVVPLRRALFGKIPRVYCWQEQVMLNQVARGLFKAADMDAEIIRTPSNCHWYAFRRAMVELGIRPAHPRIMPYKSPDFNLELALKIEQENQADEQLRRYVSLFCLTVGSSQWEHFFGRYWDEVKPGKDD